MDTPEDDEPITLSATTIAALKDFYVEKDAREKQFDELKARAQDDADCHDLSMEAFTEDWNASQFWYDEETALTLAGELLAGATKETTVAVISAPSVFVKIKHILASKPRGLSPKIYLLEFDQRFSVFKEFIHYDFHHPLKLPADLRGSCDRVICDPPFLSDDCQTKVAMTARWLSKADKPVMDPLRLIVCTGERMGNLVQRVHKKVGLRTTTFEPKHAKGLSNEFACYANFECGVWKWSSED